MLLLRQVPEVYEVCISQYHLYIVSSTQTHRGAGTIQAGEWGLVTV